MDTLIDLVKRFQRSSDPVEKLALADELVVRLSPDLHLYITLRSQTQNGSLEVDDILQEALLGITLGLKKFAGDNDSQFFGFCYDICRKRIVDALRRHGRIHAHEFSGDELWAKILAVENKLKLTPEQRDKLRDAMNLLEEVRPPCVTYLVAHYLDGLTFKEMQEEEEFGFPSEAAAYMATRRCLELARELVAE
jgi:RNA polymerase sigma factor (sigma-70 family)